MISPYILLENNLPELEKGTNVATIFEEGKVLQKIRNTYVFKKTLEFVGRNDLAKKLEIFIYPGK